MKKAPVPHLVSRHHVRLSPGQLYTLLGLIDIGLHECTKSLSDQDLRHLVGLHQLFLQKLSISGPDYVIRDGLVVNARNPNETICRVGRRNFSRLTLALSNG